MQKLEQLKPEINEQLLLHGQKLEMKGNFLGFIIEVGAICEKYFVKDGRFKMPSIFRYPGMIVAFYQLITKTFAIHAR